VHDACGVLHPHAGGDRFQEANKELISEIIRNRQSSFLTTDYIF
jgi:glyceraldehyde-3-phosphate dehydrogenase (NADP+)